MKVHPLFFVAERKSISPKVLFKTVELAWICTRAEWEGHKSSFGLVLGNPASIEGTVGQGLIEDLPKSSKFGDCSDLFECCGPLEDWKSVAVVVDGVTGEIKSLADLSKMSLEDPYEHITRITNAIAIIVKQVSTVRVYYNGNLKSQIIVNRKRGQIEERRYESLEKYIRNLSILNRRIVSKILGLALRISEQRHGALFFLGGTSGKEDFRHAMGKVNSILHLKKASDMTDTKLKSKALEDGATWVDTNGVVRGYGLKLLGPGGRHAIARYVTRKDPKMLAIVVSQDGEISLFSNGRSNRLATKIFQGCEFHPLGIPPRKEKIAPSMCPF